MASSLHSQLQSALSLTTCILTSHSLLSPHTCKHGSLQTPTSSPDLSLKIPLILLGSLGSTVTFSKWFPFALCYIFSPHWILSSQHRFYMCVPGNMWRGKPVHQINYKNIPEPVGLEVCSSMLKCVLSPHKALGLKEGRTQKPLPNPEMICPKCFLWGLCLHMDINVEDSKGVSALGCHPQLWWLLWDNSSPGVQCYAAKPKILSQKSQGIRTAKAALQGPREEWERRLSEGAQDSVVRTSSAGKAFEKSQQDRVKVQFTSQRSQGALSMCYVARMQNL